MNPPMEMEIEREHEHLTWAEFGDVARELASLALADGFAPTVLLAIAGGGLPVGGAVSYALGLKNCCVINVEYYTGVDERLEVPVILPPALHLVDLGDQRLLVVDDVADTGETGVSSPTRSDPMPLTCARRCCTEPRSVVRCDDVWRRTDRWIDFPWSTLPPVTP